MKNRSSFQHRDSTQTNGTSDFFFWIIVCGQHIAVRPLRTMAERSSPTASSESSEGAGDEKARCRRILLGEEEPEDEIAKGLCQKIYESLGYSKKVLVTLCIGLVDKNNLPLIDIESPPWSKENKQTIKPSNVDLVTEVLRRQKVEKVSKLWTFG
jgi:hypothetical protein